ncbi:MAG: hypothetical protein Q9221_007195, partial [Calogaya cf. arnoldii]
MDPLGITARLMSNFQIYTGYSKTLQLAGRQQTELIARAYGPFLASVIAWYLPPETARRYESIHYDVLRGSKEEAMNFRQSVTDEYNMTAVAGAIIAQVAITALSLPFLSNTHWTSRACFLIAVTSGCLSVFYACVLQRIVGKLYNAEQVKGWLILPGPETGTEEGSRGVENTSLAAILILSAPSNMVKVAIFAFLVGLAIYQDFIFTKNLDENTAPGDSRNSFIALMVGTGLCILGLSTTFSAKDIESTMRSQFSRLNERSPRNVTGATSESLEPTGMSWRDKPSGTTGQFPYLQETAHEREPAHDQQRVQSPRGQALASLLENAAQAHAQ